MEILALIAGIAMLALISQFVRRRVWQAAERDVSARLALGSDGVVPGAQSLYYGGHARAVLLLHGFGDTPQSLAELAERLVEAGWTVSLPLLPGHGRTLAAFSAAGADEWRAAAERALDELAQKHEQVFVCGQSMGAALAVSLAVQRSLPVVALLAPYVSMPVLARWGAAFWPAVQLFAPVITTRDPRSVRDREAAERSLAYGYVTPRLLAELWRVVRRARRDAGRLRSATLIVHSREDNRVPPRAVVAVASRMRHAAKEFHWVSGCGHVISVDYCKERVMALVVEWLERRTAPHGSATTAR